MSVTINEKMKTSGRRKAMARKKKRHRPKRNHKKLGKIKTKQQTLDSIFEQGTMLSLESPFPLKNQEIEHLET